MKLAYGPEVIRACRSRERNTESWKSPIEETLARWRRRSNKRVQDVVVMMLDRPRHKEIVAANSRVRALRCA